MVGTVSVFVERLHPCAGLIQDVRPLRVHRCQYPVLFGNTGLLWFLVKSPCTSVGLTTLWYPCGPIITGTIVWAQKWADFLLHFLPHPCLCSPYHIWVFSKGYLSACLSIYLILTLQMDALGWLAPFFRAFSNMWSTHLFRNSVSHHSC